MNIKTNLLSKILYMTVLLLIVALSIVIIGLPWVMPFVFKNSIFYTLVNHTELLVILYITGILALIILFMTLRLCQNIIKRNPFSKSSIKSLKNISAYSAGVFVCYLYICIFMAITLGTLVITFGAFLISLVAAILYKLVEVAADIQRENELTI